MNSIGSVQNKNILFLQGPMGSFFKKIELYFRGKGANTYKIGFNRGDQFYAHADSYIAFKAQAETWPIFIESFLREKDITKIFLFGDCRYYQHIAREVAYAMGIDVYVFEEGYVRPYYITLEKYGVNHFSKLSRDARFYDLLEEKEIPIPKHTPASKLKMTSSAVLYYGLSNVFKFQYPYYKHHRDFSAIKEAYYGFRGAYRKFFYSFKERKCVKLLEGTLSKNYYFVPLQTHNDFQVLEHSNYRSIEKFIIEVLESFSNNAPSESFLVFKHHPVDRGRKNYSLFIKEQAHLLGLENRVYAFHDVHLPTCLRHAKACITINSTVGLSAIGHNIATLTLGRAVYNIEGLTNKGKILDDFWCEYEIPNVTLYKKFKYYLIMNTQLNGSFYGTLPEIFNID